MTAALPTAVLLLTSAFVAVLAQDISPSLATAAPSDRDSQAARSEFTTQYLIITIVGGVALMVGTIVGTVLCFKKEKRDKCRRNTVESESGDSARTVPTTIGRQSQSRIAWTGADDLPSSEEIAAMKKAARSGEHSRGPSDDDEPTTDAGDRTDSGRHFLVETAGSSGSQSPVSAPQRPSFASTVNGAMVNSSLNGSRASTHAQDLTCDDVDDAL